jgi:Protein of unknown function (DUF2934)
MAKPRVPKKISDDTSVNPAAQIASNEVVAAQANGNGDALNGGAKKTVRQKTTAKPEIVRSDSRATIVPINLEDEIRRLAYLLAERRGFEPGHESDDWFAAEQEIRQRYHQYSA